MVTFWPKALYGSSPAQSDCDGLAHRRFLQVPQSYPGAEQSEGERGEVFKDFEKRGVLQRIQVDKAEVSRTPSKPVRVGNEVAVFSGIPGMLRV